MSFLQSWSVAFATAIAFAVPLSAQEKVPGDVAVPPPTSSASVAVPSTSLAAPLVMGPTVPDPLAPSPAQLGQRWNVATEPTAASLPVPFVPQQGQGRHVAMMVVGGAGLVVGSLIDGDTGTVVMAGSAVVGLIGLYRYLR